MWLSPEMSFSYIACLAPSRFGAGRRHGHGAAAYRAQADGTIAPGAWAARRKRAAPAGHRANRHVDLTNLRIGCLRWRIMLTQSLPRSEPWHDGRNHSLAPCGRGRAGEMGYSHAPGQSHVSRQEDASSAPARRSGLPRGSSASVQIERRSILGHGRSVIYAALVGGPAGGTAL